MSNKQQKDIVDSFLKSVECIKIMQNKEWVFGDTKLYSSQMHTIRAIGNSGELNLTDLASKMGITKAGASKFVVKLQDSGFIKKYQSDNNKKEVYFNLTEKGELAYKEHDKFSKKTFSEIYKMMDELNTQELAIADRFMKKLSLILEDASN